MYSKMSPFRSIKSGSLLALFILGRQGPFSSAAKYGEMHNVSSDTVNSRSPTCKCTIPFCSLDSLVESCQPRCGERDRSFTVIVRAIA